MICKNGSCSLTVSALRLSVTDLRNAFLTSAANQFPALIESYSHHQTIHFPCLWLKHADGLMIPFLLYCNYTNLFIIHNTVTSTAIDSVIKGEKICAYFFKYSAIVFRAVGEKVHPPSSVLLANPRTWTKLQNLQYDQKP